LATLEACRAKLVSGKPVSPHRSQGKLAAFIVTLAMVAAIPLAFLMLRQEPRMVATVPEKSIAVLPFENLSKDEANAFFAGGVQDEILSDLAKIAELKVISRTSVMKYKSTSERNLREIGRALGVAHIVEGSVQRVANHVRVNAQLIDARTDAHLWAETYDGDLADVFGIQSEIAQRIADQLRAKMSPTEKAAIMERPTADLTAYALYNEAKALGAWADWNDLDQSRARRLELLREAVRRDPNFVLAYCLLAKLYGRSHAEAQFASRDSASVDALWKQAIDDAMRLRPDLGEPHLARARYYLFTNNFEAARDELALARRLLPNDSELLFITARVDRHQNRWEESLVNLRAASALDPHNGEIIMWECEMYRLMRRYFEGEQFARQAMASMPELTSSLHVELAKLKLAEGDPCGAQEILTRVPQDKDPEARFQTALYLRDYDAAARVIAATPADQAEGAFVGSPPRSLANGALALARGDNKAAQAAFLGARQDWEQDQVRGPNNEWYFTNIALLDAGLGRKEEAIREAKRAVEMVPIARDALFGVGLMVNLALVYAWTGERDMAIEKLEMLSKIPNDVSYGDLRFNPRWDSLHNDPRFEKIIASLEPKNIDQ
jgi:serine/threonine-protein kinase